MVAYSTLCEFKDYRPTVGLINMNSVFLEDPPSSEILLFNRHLYTIIHEVLHILGFNWELFKYFIDENGVLLDFSLYFEKTEETFNLKLPKLVELAQNYFDCYSITAVKLEN